MGAFGEVLFDVFPSYTRLGGAPLNVTCHASRLGLYETVHPLDPAAAYVEGGA